MLFFISCLFIYFFPFILFTYLVEYISQIFTGLHFRFDSCTAWYDSINLCCFCYLLFIFVFPICFVYLSSLVRLHNFLHGYISGSIYPAPDVILSGISRVVLVIYFYIYFPRTANPEFFTNFCSYIYLLWWGLTVLSRAKILLFLRGRISVYVYVLHSPRRIFLRFVRVCISVSFTLSQIYIAIVFFVYCCCLYFLTVRDVKRWFLFYLLFCFCFVFNDVICFSACFFEYFLSLWVN